MSPLTRTRAWLIFFVVCLVLAGITAFPLEAELRLLLSVLRADWSPAPEHFPALVAWIERVQTGVVETNRDHPFMAYGTDWLAFAHLMIAVAFWGPIKDPVRNVWVVHFGMISCLAIIPMVLIAGPIRDIPWGWQVVDASFGVFGMIPLLFVHREIRKLTAGAAPATEAAGSATRTPAGV